jgi:2-succinyl-5-enolpyruvyl-6-hydroxy-3-cyclohexene-1-carboxylate synthase
MMVDGTEQADWAREILRCLAETGLRDVVISPGSRSTPFVLAAAAEPRLRRTLIKDERSAAFFALGQARISQRPSLLICTSGTAAAHYFPAVIEAATSRVPLLILSADRPLELMDGGANQTIDQIKLFGDFVRAFVEIGLADEAPGAWRGLRRRLVQAYELTLGQEAGPVHLNGRARPPLEGRASVVSVKPAIPRHAASLRSPNPDAIARLAAACALARRGLIVAGPGRIAQRDDAAAVFELARRTQFPLLADVASQWRCGRPADIAGIDHYFLSLADQQEPPDLVIQIGAPLTTTAFARALERWAPAQHWILAEAWLDAENTATEWLDADLGKTLEMLLAALTPGRRDSMWRDHWLERDRRAAEIIADVLGTTFCEGAVVKHLLKVLPAGTFLTVGNSLPIRHVDAFTSARVAPVSVLSQRGASGIDGLLSGALGAAAVGGLPGVLLIGDVSLLHDLNALELAGALGQTFVIVLLNNGGGRIFEQLPIAQSAPELDAWTTPHSLEFRGAAEMFGVAYARATSWSDLEEALAAAFAHPGATLLEVKVAAHGAVEINAELKRRWSA